MPCRMCQWPRLAPTGHAPVDQPRITFKADLRPQAKALHHAGAEAFDQHVGAVDQLQQHFSGAGFTRINRNAAASAPEQAAIGIEKTGRMTVDANDLRAHVRQHHGGERRRTDRIHFNYFHTCQRSGHLRVLFCYREAVRCDPRH
ncbi:hypothetical protein D3C72_1608130 [compost metagenome]